jgi:hypothetical protein
VVKTFLETHPEFIINVPIDTASNLIVRQATSPAIPKYWIFQFTYEILKQFKIPWN